MKIESRISDINCASGRHEPKTTSRTPVQISQISFIYYIYRLNFFYVINLEFVVLILIFSMNELAIKRAIFNRAVLNLNLEFEFWNLQ